MSWNWCCVSRLLYNSPVGVKRPLPILKRERKTDEEEIIMAHSTARLWKSRCIGASDAGEALTPHGEGVRIENMAVRLSHAAYAKGVQA